MFHHKYLNGFARNKLIVYLKSELYDMQNMTQKSYLSKAKEEWKEIC